MAKSFEDVTTGAVVRLEEYSLEGCGIMIGDDSRIITTPSGKAVILDTFENMELNQYMVSRIVNLIQPDGFKERLLLEKTEIDEKVIGIRSFLNLMGDTPMNNLFNQQAQVPHLDFTSIDLIKQQLRNMVDYSDTLEQRIRILNER